MYKQAPDTDKFDFLWFGKQQLLLFQCKTAKGDYKYVGLIYLLHYPVDKW